LPGGGESRSRRTGTGSENETDPVLKRILRRKRMVTLRRVRTDLAVLRQRTACLWTKRLIMTKAETKRKTARRTKTMRRMM
jgi:hypothetical protein